MVRRWVPEQTHFITPADKDYVIEYRPLGIFYIEVNSTEPYAKEDPTKTMYLDSSSHYPFVFEREALESTKYKKLMVELGMGVKEVLVEVSQEVLPEVLEAQVPQEVPQ